MSDAGSYNVKNIFRGKPMKDYIEERAAAIANYIIEHHATVRQTAKKFGISKSTVHKDAGVIIGIVKGSAEKP
jgi:DNA invertase Pin-like site-specific DNA recombinase